jgi:hypothetical protein
VAAIAAMALASSASATILTSPEGTTYTGELQAEAIGALVVHNNSFSSYTCGTSTASGKVEAHGASTTVSGLLASWTLGNCNKEVKVLKLGKIEIHTEKESSNGNGIVTASGTEVTIFDGSTDCIYTTNNTYLGVLTGSNTTGGNAKLLISSAAVPRTGGSVFCGTSGTLTGEYKITSPSTLYID